MPTPRTDGVVRRDGRDPVDRLAVLQERGTREEERADEERESSGPQPDGVRIPRHGAEPEQGGTDDEQDRDPPATAARSSPLTHRNIVPSLDSYLGDVENCTKHDAVTDASQFWNERTWLMTI